MAVREFGQFQPLNYFTGLLHVVQVICLPIASRNIAVRISVFAIIKICLTFVPTSYCQFDPEDDSDMDLGLPTSNSDEFR